VLPSSVLSHDELRGLFASIQTVTVAGIRDLAMLELAYSSGLRAGELLGLNLGDIDWINRTALVTGKGAKQRVVPIGRKAFLQMQAYLEDARRSLPRIPKETALFLDRRGRRLPYHTLRRLVHRHARRFGIATPVTPHTFRRSCTTELIRAGANLYHVKELLGHESLETLKHYTRLTILDLKQTHARCHPREREYG
jgi:site-specific recombinase XerD